MSGNDNLFLSFRQHSVGSGWEFDVAKYSRGTSHLLLALRVCIRYCMTTMLVITVLRLAMRLADCTVIIHRSTQHESDCLNLHPASVHYFFRQLRIHAKQMQRV